MGLLNEALATEIVCTLRYRRHYFMADGLEAEAVKQEFLTHAAQELAYVARIATRIVQLDGEPNLDPRGLAERSHAEYVAGDSLEAMIREHLVAERIAIDSYKEMIRYVGTHDPTTRRLLDEILAQEHAEDLSSMLRGIALAARARAKGLPARVAMYARSSATWNMWELCSSCCGVSAPLPVSEMGSRDRPESATAARHRTGVQCQSLPTTRTIFPDKTMSARVILRKILLRHSNLRAKHESCIKPIVDRVRRGG